VKRFASLAVVLVLAGCGSSHHAVKAIAYTKFLRGGGEEVWIAAPDGSHKRRLAQGGSPQLSPDGRWVAFRRPCARYGDCLFLVSRAGGKPTLLARNAFPSFWSSDGRGVLAYRPVTEEIGRLLVVDRDADDAVTVASGNLVGWSFSPDGKHVAYALQRGAHADVLVVPARGGSSRRVTHDGRSSLPVWTAKGILVSHAITGRRVPHHGWGANEIWLVDPDSGNPRSLSGPLPGRILGSGITGLEPIAWSDGSLLAGLINEFGAPPFAVDPRARTVRQIGNFGFAGFAEGLSHNGRQLLVEVATQDRDRNQRVIVMSFAGGSQRVIARFAGDASWNL
jgi:Tol biopolymer transport system component